MNSELRGYECILSLGGNTMGDAADVTVNDSMDPQEITKRANAGAKGEQPGLRQITISGDALYARSHASVDALIRAYKTRTQIAFALSDPSGSAEAGNGYLYKLERKEALKDAVTFSFEFRSNGAITDAFAGTTTAGV